MTNVRLVIRCERCHKQQARIRAWITSGQIPLGCYDVCRDCLICLELENIGRTIQTRWIDQTWKCAECGREIKKFCAGTYPH